MLSGTRVAKTYAPHQNGAKRFARRYGENLVCVRSRLSDDGRMRHTTIELWVESTPVATRARSMVAIKIESTDRSNRTLLLAHGAKWVSKSRYWLIPRQVAKNLRLLKNAVPILG